MTRAVVTGAIIAALGPLLGFAAVLVWVLLDRSVEAALYLTGFPDILVMPYLFGAPPAFVAGGVAGWRIWQAGGITLRFWLVATVVFSFTPALLFLAFRGTPASIQHVTDEEIAAMYIAAAVFASLALRLLLSAAGLLHKSGEG